MAKMTKVLAAVVLAAAISELVLADADAEFKAKLGAAVIPLLRKGIKIEDNWVRGEEIMYVCTKGKFDYVRDTGLGVRTGHSMGTLAHAQEACSTNSIKTLLANKAGGLVKTEQDCKNLVEKTLSDPVLCNRKESENSFRMKDLEGVRVLFVGAARYEALAVAVKLKTQTKLGIAGKETCPERTKFCYQCVMPRFVAVGCIADGDSCRSKSEPQGDPTKMLTVNDLEAICKTPTMHETQNECKAFLERALYEIDICAEHTINKLSQMIALIKPPTPTDPDTGRAVEDTTDYYSRESRYEPLHQLEHRKPIRLGKA